MKKHFFWIGELFIWLLVLCTVSGGIMLTRYMYKREFNTYQIFLPDVDGLINGSPVRLMGIQIGYVSQVNIVGEEVYIKFVITQKGVKLPKGSIATVEFAGLGGSKSLEIYPPSAAGRLSSSNVLIVQSPKRIHDSLGLLNEMFEKIVDITCSVSSFMNQVGIIKVKNSINGSGNEYSAEEIIEKADGWLDKANGKKSNETKEKPEK